MKRILLFLTFIITLFLIGCNKQSMLPKNMPDDFSFSIKWDFDGTYDSKTKILSNGYNYDLDTECKTELVLSNDQLREIYEMCEKNDIDNYNGTIKTNQGHQKPSSDLILTIIVNNQEYKIVLCNSYLNDNFDEYITGKEVAIVIKRIVENYILSSDEYKNLPVNQQAYD